MKRHTDPPSAEELEAEQRKADVREEWRWQDRLGEALRHGMDYEQATEFIQAKKDRESGMSPSEVIMAKWRRKDDLERDEHWGNLDAFCTKEVTAALAEYGPDNLDLAEVCEELKENAFPQYDGVAAEVDAWFNGPVCAALVAAARNPAPDSSAPVGADLLHVPVDVDRALAPEPVPARVPLSAFVSSVAAALCGRLVLEFDPDELDDLDMSRLAG